MKKYIRVYMLSNTLIARWALGSVSGSTVGYGGPGFEPRGRRVGCGIFFAATHDAAFNFLSQ